MLALRICIGTAAGERRIIRQCLGPNYVDDFWSPTRSAGVLQALFGLDVDLLRALGLLPYHYGRWYGVPFYGWSGYRVRRSHFNFWSPGLVSFYSGPGWGLMCPRGPETTTTSGIIITIVGIYSRQLADLQHLHSRRPGDLS